jgi:hypothetical protein
MRIATQIPVASTALTPLGAGAVCPPTAGDGGAPANLPDLPCWARNDEARALLAKIAEARPDRTKPLTESATGATASFGYRGRVAARLRELYEAFESERMDWLAECPFPSRQWDNRRQAIIDYGKAHSADVLIAQVLG